MSIENSPSESCILANFYFSYSTEYAILDLILNMSRCKSRNLTI